MSKNKLKEIFYICLTKCTLKHILIIFCLNVIATFIASKFLLKDASIFISFPVFLLICVIVDGIFRYIFIYKRHRFYYLINDHLNIISYDITHKHNLLKYSGALVMDINAAFSDYYSYRRFLRKLKNTMRSLYDRKKLSDREFYIITDKYIKIRKHLNEYHSKMIEVRRNARRK